MVLSAIMSSLGVRSARLIKISTCIEINEKRYKTMLANTFVGCARHFTSAGYHKGILSAYKA